MSVVDRTEFHDRERSGRTSVSEEIGAKIEITLDDLCVFVPDVSRSTIKSILMGN